ncbi:MAG: AAA family ATPase [Fibrobacter sp.]|nr:AAA family ATPase [Fibrobacter sp.]
MYTVKNFRKFDKKGASFEIAPITILTGKNSSGKSTLIKSMRFLSDVFEKSNIDNVRLNIDGYLDALSNSIDPIEFDRYLNDSATGKNRTIAFEYSTTYKGSGYVVSLSFNHPKKQIDPQPTNHELGEVQVENLIIKRDGSLFYNYRKPYFDIHPVMDEFWEFYLKKNEGQMPLIDKHDIELASKYKILFPNSFLLQLATADKKTIDNAVAQIIDEVVLQIGWNNAIEKLGAAAKWIKKLYGKIIKADAIEHNGEEFLIRDNDKKSELLKLWNPIIDNFKNSKFNCFIKYYQNLEKQFVDFYGPQKALRELNMMKFCKDLPAINARFEEFLCIEEALLEMELSKEGSWYATSISDLCVWMDLFIEDVLRRLLEARPPYLKNMEFVPSTRATVKDVYMYNDKSDELSEMLHYYSSLPDKEKEIASTFLNKWVKEFEIGDGISIEPCKPAYGSFVFVKKNGKTKLLSDEGYGITQLVSVILSIQLALYKKEKDEKITPVVAIEEPEIHLHPKYQSLLAYMFYDACQQGIRFIIETHSEYLIRRSQVLVSDLNCETQLNLKEKNPFRVYYFPESGVPYDMVYKPDGFFVNSFGTGFLDEAGKWHLKLLSK